MMVSASSVSSPRIFPSNAIRNDPEWNNGNYTTQPRSARFASVFYGIATNGGTLAYQKLAPTRESADKLVDDRLSAPFTAEIAYSAREIPPTLMVSISNPKRHIIDAISAP